MSDLPRPSGKELVSFLQKAGFDLVRVTGSHHFLRRDGQHTCVPVHGNQTLKIGTLRGILRDIGMSVTEFRESWQRGR